MEISSKILGHFSLCAMGILSFPVQELSVEAKQINDEILLKLYRSLGF